MMSDRIRVFLDCEFTSLNKDAELISIAMVSEDGAELYIEIKDVKDTDAYKVQSIDQKEWLEINVFSNFFIEKDIKGMRGAYYNLVKKNCTGKIEQWLLDILKEKKGEKIEFWGDVPAYDWVLLCDLWGGARNMPEYIHYIIRDLGTYIETKEIAADMPRASLLNEKVLGKLHNALYDARVSRSIWRHTK
jgi:hypothetical protein